MKHSCVDAFSGAGGLALGIQQAGYDVLLGFDSDPRCIETQRRNRQYFNHEAVEAGIEEMLNGGLLERVGLQRGDLFLLAGGPPCQGFSIQRIGEDKDTRNSLVLMFVELIKEVHPHYFLMENVPGIRGKRGKEILRVALERAEEAGYWIHQRVLDAQDFGVPQRRRRVFVVGESVDGVFRNFRFPEPTTPEGHRVTVRQTISHLPQPPEDGTDHPDFPHHRRDMLSDLNKQRLEALLPGQGRDHLPEDLLANCHTVKSAKIGHRNVYGRMSWDEVSPTITARFDSFTRGQFGHPEQLRSISLREGALLQRFPEDFLFAGSKVEIARQIGNAVPPLLAKILAQQILLCHIEKSRIGTDGVRTVL